jgi:hypothetical protein
MATDFVALKPLILRSCVNLATMGILVAGVHARINASNFTIVAAGCASVVGFAAEGSGVASIHFSCMAFFFAVLMVVTLSVDHALVSRGVAGIFRVVVVALVIAVCVCV